MIHFYKRAKEWKWQQQKELCAFCGEKCPSPIIPVGDPNEMSVREHNHDTQQWTVTHQRCNRKIASWTIDNVAQLIKYLEHRDEKIFKSDIDEPLERITRLEKILAIKDEMLQLSENHIQKLENFIKGKVDDL